jgi:hypothetical protein
MGRQFIIQMENRPGELAHIAKALAARGIDIRHIATAGAGSCACAFVTTTDPAATRAVLGTLGNLFIEGSPILVELDDVPGALAEAYSRLADAHVNVLGTLMVGRKPGKVEVAFSVDDEAAARVVLGVTDMVGVTD